MKHTTKNLSSRGHRHFPKQLCSQIPKGSPHCSAPQLNQKEGQISGMTCSFEINEKTFNSVESGLRKCLFSRTNRTPSRCYKLEWSHKSSHYRYKGILTEPPIQKPTMLALEETRKYCLTQLTTFSFEYWNCFFYEQKEKANTEHYYKIQIFFCNRWNAMRINMHKVQNNFSLKKKIKLFFPPSPIPTALPAFRYCLYEPRKGLIISIWKKLLLSMKKYKTFAFLII